MLRSVYTSYEIQSELSSAFFRKAHPGHTVVATVWQGSRIVDTYSCGTYPTEKEAQTEIDRLRAQAQ